LSNYNVTHNGYHNTEAYYRSSYADGSLFNLLQQYSPSPTLAPSFAPTLAPALAAPFYQNLMSTQQNLFAGWNSFCGCSGPQPQPPAASACGTSQCGTNRRRVDVHMHHHFYQNGCGGPFNYGGSASSTSQSHTAFGSQRACNSWQQSCQNSCYSPFLTNTYQSFGFGYTGLYGTPPNHTGYSGSYGNPGGVYSGSYGNPGGVYSGSYGNPGGAYQGAYNNSYSAFQASFAASVNNTYGLPQTLPSYNWGDFSASFGRDSNSPFGVIPSSYAGYAMTSPFTSFGTAAGLAAIGGALSLLF
jgi:hypothetical protein